MKNFTFDKILKEQNKKKRTAIVNVDKSNLFLIYSVVSLGYVDIVTSNKIEEGLIEEYGEARLNEIKKIVNRKRKSPMERTLGYSPLAERLKKEI